MWSLLPKFQIRISSEFKNKLIFKMVTTETKKVCCEKHEDPEFIDQPHVPFVAQLIAQLAEDEYQRGRQSVKRKQTDRDIEAQAKRRRIKKRASSRRRRRALPKYSGLLSLEGLKMFTVLDRNGCADDCCYGVESCEHNGSGVI